MADIVTFIIGLVICVAFAVVLTIVQLKLRKKADARKAAADKTSAAAAANEKFVIGRIYQMPDGSLAKYVGDGRFLKVKEE